MFSKFQFYRFDIFLIIRIICKYSMDKCFLSQFHESFQFGQIITGRIMIKRIISGKIITERIITEWITRTDYFSLKKLFSTKNLGILFTLRLVINDVILNLTESISRIFSVLYRLEESLPTPWTSPFFESSAAAVFTSNRIFEADPHGQGHWTYTSLQFTSSCSGEVQF